jgi:hypothetical protein
MILDVGAANYVCRSLCHNRYISLILWFCVHSFGADAKGLRHTPIIAQRFLISEE